MFAFLLYHNTFHLIFLVIETHVLKHARDTSATGDFEFVFFRSFIYLNWFLLVIYFKYGNVYMLTPNSQSSL